MRACGSSGASELWESSVAWAESSSCEEESDEVTEDVRLSREASREAEKERVVALNPTSARLWVGAEGAAGVWAWL